MTDRLKSLTGLSPGVPACPEDATRPRRRLNPVELLWFAGAFVVVFEFSTHFLVSKPSSPDAPPVAESHPEEPPAEQNLAIWPVLGNQYPGLRRDWHDYAGTRYVAVPDMFWNSMLPAEKTQLAGDLDVLFPARRWVVVTGPYSGRGEMALREVHHRSELVTDRPAVDAIAVAEIPEPAPVAESAPAPEPAPLPEPAPVPEPDLVQAARAALEADPIVEEPAVASSAPERPAPPPGFPDYEILFQTDDPLGRRVFAEVLVSALSPRTPKRDRRRVSRVIAELEGLDDLTLYCTRQAHEAHYSMDYADAHPDALARGLLGTLERGRFRPYKPR